MFLPRIGRLLISTVRYFHCPGHQGSMLYSLPCYARTLRCLHNSICGNQFVNINGWSALVKSDRFLHSDGHLCNWCSFITIIWLILPMKVPCTKPARAAEGPVMPYHPFCSTASISNKVVLKCIGWRQDYWGWPDRNNHKSTNGAPLAGAVPLVLPAEKFSQPVWFYLLMLFCLISRHLRISCDSKPLYQRRSFFLPARRSLVKSPDGISSNACL